MSKGSSRRGNTTDERKRFAVGWERIFGKKPRKKAAKKR